jgi:succinate-semialdehyde dehydrogenase/glutarate-semialdehyde dehydrogenase
MDYTDLYIDGEWRKGAERFDVINPATEEVLASVASADHRGCRRGARRRRTRHGRLGRAEAARTLRGAAPAWELMTARLDHFAHLITLENGKAGADAKGEATYAAEFFRWFAEEAVRADGLITHAPASGARIVVQHKPAGLAVLVTPWNYPAAMGTRKIAPALAAGCGVIIKPASETPLTMLALMPLLEEAGVPKGLVNVLPSKKDRRAGRSHAARSARAGGQLHRLHRGGPQALKSAADQVLKPAMELGGNAPVLVLKDADMDTAIEGTMLAKMRNLGEACTAANRIYVHESLAEAFTEKLSARMSH